MASVVGFTKMTNSDGKYDIKICTKEPYSCDIQVGYYRIINNKPHLQYFPFPSTIDNVNVFIPSRIVEEKSGELKRYVWDLFREKPSCLAIDPCNVYTRDYCCKDAKFTISKVEDDANTAKKIESSSTSSVKKDGDDNTGIWWIVILTITVVLLLVGVIGTLIYVAHT